MSTPISAVGDMSREAEMQERKVVNVGSENVESCEGRSWASKLLA